MPRPAMSASTRATSWKSLSVWLSLPARMRPQNSPTSASGWRSPMKELVLGKSLSSIQTPATSRWQSLRTRRRTLLKFPKPVIAVEQDGDADGIRHEVEHLEELGPGGFVVVPHAESRRHGESGGPNSLEARFFDDLGGKPVMGLHDEGELWRAQQLPEPRGPGKRRFFLCVPARAASEHSRHGPSPRRARSQCRRSVPIRPAPRNAAAS